MMTRQQEQKLTHDPSTLSLSDLRNVGKATLGDFKLLNIKTVRELALQDADELWLRLSALTGVRQDPCVHDVFAAAIHQARTGEAKNWWVFTPARKERQKRGEFLVAPRT